MPLTLCVPLRVLFKRLIERCRLLYPAHDYQLPIGDSAWHCAVSIIRTRSRAHVGGVLLMIY